MGIAIGDEIRIRRRNRRRAIEAELRVIESSIEVLREILKKLVEELEE